MSPKKLQLGVSRGCLTAKTADAHVFVSSVLGILGIGKYHERNMKEPDQSCKSSPCMFVKLLFSKRQNKGV